MTARDLVATLGWSRDDGLTFAHRYGSVEDYASDAWDALTLAHHVIGNIQEAVLRELIDTSWPLCQHHRTHPLTIDEDTNDPTGFTARIPLGWLDVVWPSSP